VGDGKEGEGRGVEIFPFLRGKKGRGDLGPTKEEKKNGDPFPPYTIEKKEGERKKQRGGKK